MSRILVASTPLLGHVTPMLQIAAAFQKYGHEVSFLTSSGFQEKVELQGLHFRALSGHANYDWRNLRSMFTEAESGAEGLEQHIIHLKRLFADSLPGQAAALDVAIQKWEPDLIVVDVLYLGVLPLLLKNGSRPAVMSCGVIAPMWRDNGFSPFAGPDSSIVGQKRNITDGLHFDEAVRPGTEYIDEILKRLSVGVPGGFEMFETMYRLPDRLMQLTVDEFEYPLVERRDNLRFAGPLLPQPSDATSAPQWLKELADSMPLIFVTQGTVANTDFDQLINPAIAALADEPVTVVVTAGSGDISRIALAPNAVVKPYIPYEHILPKTSVFLTNGGYNGVQTALSFGVPIISAGSTEDKPYVGARVDWSGVGIDLKTGTPSEEQIRLAVRKALVRHGYQTKAKAIGERIRQSDALAAIVAEAELLCGSLIPNN
ncbi:MGT family glycosyltransferase [Granulicella aggregans]|uniref:MGT family glycosyltransferase n=1 Tax=Granulicella aggregans TaxID=474949 RepID=A0A7W8E6X4_9BACT|nr:nucleotide disphospho-sugar-binding domain-containing protein [Granulicella aggregans]MBB5061111.1 MGT family glycosyltransferase [Granulicella aggregans]